MPQPNYHDGGWHSRSKFVWEPPDRLTIVRRPEQTIQEGEGMPNGQDPPSRYEEALQDQIRFLRRTVEKRDKEIATLSEKVKIAIETIEGLAEQQAMRDDWYVEKLDRIKEGNA